MTIKSDLMDGVALPSQDPQWPTLHSQWSDNSGKTWHDTGPVIREKGDSILVTGLPSSKFITIRLVPNG